MVKFRENEDERLKLSDGSVLCDPVTTDVNVYFPDTSNSLNERVIQTYGRCRMRVGRIRLKVCRRSRVDFIVKESNRKRRRNWFIYKVMEYRVSRWTKVFRSESGDSKQNVSFFFFFVPVSPVETQGLRNRKSGKIKKDFGNSI